MTISSPGAALPKGTERQRPRHFSPAVRREAPHRPRAASPTGPSTARSVAHRPIDRAQRRPQAHRPRAASPTGPSTARSIAQRQGPASSSLGGSASALGGSSFWGFSCACPSQMCDPPPRAHACGGATDGRAGSEVLDESTATTRRRVTMARARSVERARAYTHTQVHESTTTRRRVAMARSVTNARRADDDDVAGRLRPLSKARPARAAAG